MAVVDYYLKLDGIEGESSDSGHKGEIVVESYSLGVSQSGTGHFGGGSGAGKAHFDNMTFTARVNKASPRIMLACATGRHIAKVVFTARKAGAGQHDYYTVTLTDVLVTGYQLQDQGEGDPAPLDTFSLEFAEIQIEYKPQQDDGSFGAPTKVGYDAKKNTKK